MKLSLIPPGELVVDMPQSSWSPANVALERIDKAFEIGATEVTVAQFEAFVEATGYKTEAERTGTGWSLKDGGWAARPDVTWRTPGYEVNPNLPVTVVSPSDAKAFCDWLSEKEGMTYRLPTTHEWYLAGRGGGTNRLGWCTEAEVLEFDWFQENLPEGVLASQGVNAKPANPFGLHGMLGNAFEFSSGARSTAFRVGNSWAQSSSNVGYGFTQNTDFRRCFRHGISRRSRSITKADKPTPRRTRSSRCTALFDSDGSATNTYSWCTQLVRGVRGTACGRKQYSL